MSKLKTFYSLLYNLNEKFLQYIDEFSLINDASHFDFGSASGESDIRSFTKMSEANHPLNKVANYKNWEELDSSV